MRVLQTNFDSVISTLSKYSVMAIDTETTGLRPYHGDKLFSIIIATDDDAYYFNFYPYELTGPDNILSKDHLEGLKDLLAEDRYYILHNAKYDMAILDQDEIRLGGTIHDTMALQRVLQSDRSLKEFSLDSMAKLVGMAKQDVAKEYLIKYKHFRKIIIPGKKQIKTSYDYTKVPLDIIVPYGEMDAKVTLTLGKWQVEENKRQRELSGKGSVFDNELLLSRTVYEMERKGVKINRSFCKEAQVYCEEEIRKAKAEFKAITGEEYRDSPLLFKKVFKDEPNLVLGSPTKVTKVQNYVFASDVLATFKHPAAKSIVAYKKAKADVNVYHGFLYEADKKGIIHTSFNQHIPVTGRFSSSSPNLQNCRKEDGEDLKKKFVIRRAIIPRPGMVFHMLDYEQMEYRLMLDYAARMPEARANSHGVMALIDKVLGGLDVHQATADVARISRQHAKTVNFSILYGSGLGSLAKSLGVEVAEAKRIKDFILNAAPEVELLIKRIMLRAEKVGRIYNWMGRCYTINNADFSYRGPNYIIQGGCADIVKLAMNMIRGYLIAYKTKLVLTIHDELVLEGPPDEASVVIPQVKKIMETAYPYKYVPLITGVDHSFKSLADKVKGVYA